ncbi:platelet endothelial cell adhesion molecule isoform X2 [Denticeps clupeoides]|uniref:platelet endothelial cell adhesion molecule isoform X2 n=1 Tax=Denticeps clupeoides TaxID=299321 RepID=UPI0010A49B44|nr:platelet endothelial cell adhesion molecule-like isoform X2 [Denticeps clupeoides]
MDTGLLFFLLLFIAWEDVHYAAYGQSSFIINSISVSIQPSASVQRDTHVTVLCQAKVSSVIGVTLDYRFSILKDESEVFNGTTKAVDHFSYIINQARVSDSGNYRCRISIEDQSKTSEHESLRVTGLQTPVLLVSSSSATEGDNVKVACSAPEERGTFTFFIFADGKNIRTKTTTQNQAEVELDISRKGTMKLTCDYTVQLLGEVERSKLSFEHAMFVQELSLDLLLTISPSYEVIEGDSVDFTCRLGRAHMHGQLSKTLSLIKDTLILKSGLNVINVNKNVLKSDSGEYMCKVMIGSAGKVDKKNLTVAEIFSQPILTISLPEVFEQDNFSLSCQSHNFSSSRIHNRDIRYSIFKDGRLLTSSGFFVKQASSTDNGNYTCKATAKSIQKESPGLVFKAKVLASQPVLSVMGKVILGRPFDICCHSENGSLPITYSLYYDEDVINTTTVQQPNTTAVFTATVNRTEFIWKFRCRAQNHGHGYMSEHLNVQVVVPLSEPQLLVAGDITEGDQVYLICSVPSGTPPITFSWYSSTTNQPLRRKVVHGNSNHHIIDSITRDMTGRYYCEAANAANQEKSNSVNIEVKLALWKKGLIAVSCLLAVTAAVIFGVVCFKAKRGKREMAAELSVKPASATPDDSVTASLSHDELYNKDAVPHFDAMDGFSPSGTWDSVPPLPAGTTYRSSY